MSIRGGQRARAATGTLRELALRKPVLVMLWLAGLYLLYVTVEYYLARDRLGGDAHAYWLTGQPWYTPYTIAPNHNDAYLYSPAFAQLIRPATWLPWPVFLALWMSAETGAFLWLLRPLGWRLALPLVLWCAPEIVIGNVLGFLGIAVVASFTRPWSWSAMVLTKPVLAVGAVWFLVKREWQSFAVSIGLAVLVTGASVALDPAGWSRWLQFLTTHATDSQGSLLVRAATALAIVICAALAGRRWMVPFALLVATPVFAGAPSLTILAAVPRLVTLRDRAGDDASTGGVLEAGDASSPGSASAGGARTEAFGGSRGRSHRIGDECS
ncbi:hypothetical protein GCM10009817_37870 [Terrabacter lapilli]|uniref:DUF2029 domain-containing protein n=1 Tax=Terrabacter lapilli TaxID=436231 RepID=A0ABP5E787_9MICO